MPLPSPNILHNDDILILHNDEDDAFCNYLSAPDYIHLSTTVATSALLECKGHKHALLITKAFKDLLLIGNQSRPKIFDGHGGDERVTLVGYTSDPKEEEHTVQYDDEGKGMGLYCGCGGALEDYVGGGCEDPQEARLVSFNTFILMTISENINRPRSRRKRPNAKGSASSPSSSCTSAPTDSMNSPSATYPTPSGSPIYQHLPMLKMVLRGVSSGLNSRRIPHIPSNSQGLVIFRRTIRPRRAPCLHNSACRCRPRRR